MFITPAYAQDGASVGGFDLVGLLPLLLIFVVFYFLMIRPQQKRAKEHRAMVENMRRGDTVVTGGGIVAKVTRVIDENEAQVEIADGVRVKVLKSTVSEVRTRGEPADAD